MEPQQPTETSPGCTSSAAAAATGDCRPEIDSPCCPTTSPRRLDRTFSDEAAAAPLSEVVSLVLHDKEKDAWRPPTPMGVPTQTRRSFEDESWRPSSLGLSDISSPPPTKDALTGTLHNSRRRRSNLSTSTAGTANSMSLPAAAAAIPGSFAVRGTSVHSSDNDSISTDEESCYHSPLENQKHSLDNNDSVAIVAPIETVVTTAKLVTSASLDESERERIFRHAVQTVTSNAVVAHVVATQKSPDPSQATFTMASTTTAATSSKSSRRRRLFLLYLACNLCVFGILIGVIPYAMNRRSPSRAMAAPLATTPPPPASPPASPRTMPQPVTPPMTPATTTNDPQACMFQGIGCRAFATTDELYQAVDRVAELIFAFEANPKSVNLTQPPPVSLLYGYPIGTWNVSLITNFSRVFDPWRHLPFQPNRAAAPRLEQDSTEATQGLATFFNEDVGGWDVSNAVTMVGMFAGAAAFTGRGLEQWDTSRVVNLSFAFLDTALFNGSISHWNTARVVGMEGMLQNAPVFDRDLSEWNVSQVTNMRAAFLEAGRFDGDLSSWDTSRVQDMRSMVREWIVQVCDILFVKLNLPLCTTT
jgi:Mycoplasma protein of unknown function, DUF285